MMNLSRRHLLKSSAGLALLSALQITVPLSASAQAVSVHDVLNGLIKKYQDEAKASMSNAEVAELFEKDGFRDYLDVYPVGDLAGGFVWKPGMGATFTGPYSKLEIKSPFTD